MTREDREFAKSRIKYLLLADNCLDKHDRESLEMAILALSQEPTDAISREAVLKKIDYEVEHYCKYLEEVDDKRNAQTHVALVSDNIREEVEQLPPVTQKSETVTEFADRCRECGARYGKLLKQQEPKIGHWIDADEWCETVDGFEQWGYFRKCSKCGYVFKFLEIDNYCPNCGECKKDGRTLDEFIEDSKESEVRNDRRDF